MFASCILRASCSVHIYVHNCHIFLKNELLRAVVIHFLIGFSKLFLQTIFLVIWGHWHVFMLAGVWILFWQILPWISGAEKTNKISSSLCCQSKGWKILFHNFHSYFPNNLWDCLFFLKFLRFARDLDLFLIHLQNLFRVFISILCYICGN